MNKSGCILLNKKRTKVALVVRKDNEYSFPKGHLEKNEKLIECALRETEEETGRIPKLILNKLYSKMKYFTDKEGEITVYMFYAIDNGKSNKNIKEEDKEEVVWVNINKVNEMLKYNNLKEFWEKVLKKLERYEVLYEKKN